MGGRAFSGLVVVQDCFAGVFVCVRVSRLKISACTHMTHTSLHMSEKQDVDIKQTEYDALVPWIMEIVEEHYGDEIETLKRMDINLRKSKSLIDLPMRRNMLVDDLLEHQQLLDDLIEVSCPAAFKMAQFLFQKLFVLLEQSRVTAENPGPFSGPRGDEWLRDKWAAKQMQQI